MRFDWFNVRDEDWREWSCFCPVEEFRVTTPSGLPGPLPESLTNKFDSVLTTAEQDETGTIYFVVNGHRIDQKDRAIDQQPFGLAFEDMTPAPSGCLIQHGNWHGRTTHPPQEFWETLRQQGYGRCQRFTEMPKMDAGPVQALRIPSQLAARRVVVRELRDFLSRWEGER